MVNQNKILGDCIEEMQKLIDDGVQIDSIVTDPPYHLTSIVKRFGKEGSAPVKVNEFFNKENGESKGSSPYKRTSTGFMGKEWDGGDVAFRSDTWKLAYNLLKPGGHLLAFSASRNYHRMAVAIEDAGFEIRDQIMWIYGSGFPKSLNIGKGVDKKQGNSEYEGWGTALKPAHEPIVMARKPLSEKSIVDNVLKWGTGAINIDGCRVGLSEGDDPRLGGKGSWKTDKMAKDVYVGGYAGEDTGSSELGRYPANVMHDGLQEEWARYFYCPKVSKSERNNSTIKNTHPTVKPIKLMRYLCRLVTPKGGVVLDPFMGSGSTGIATKQENFQFIGIEKEKEYYDIACKRIEAAIEQNDLFNF